MQKYIDIKGARKQFRNINKDPKEKLVVMTGLSGSSKTSLLLIRYMRKGKGVM